MTQTTSSSETKYLQLRGLTVEGKNVHSAGLEDKVNRVGFCIDDLERYMADIIYAETNEACYVDETIILKYVQNKLDALYDIHTKIHYRMESIINEN